VNLISTEREPVQLHQRPVSKKESADKKAITTTKAETTPQTPQKAETPASDTPVVVLARTCAIRLEQPNANNVGIGHNLGPPLDELAAPTLDELNSESAGGNNGVDLQADLRGMPRDYCRYYNL
jgi:hypothetical protein